MGMFSHEEFDGGINCAPDHYQAMQFNKAQMDAITFGAGFLRVDLIGVHYISPEDVLKHAKFIEENRVDKK